MPLITREEKGSKLTIQEMDGNLIYLESLGITDIEYSNINNTITFETTNSSEEVEIFPVQGEGEVDTGVTVYKNQYFEESVSASNIVPVKYYDTVEGTKSIQAVYGNSYTIFGKIATWNNGAYTAPSEFSYSMYSNSNYNPSPSFSIGTGFNSPTRKVAFQQDGKIIVAGEFTTYNGQSFNRIVRLNTNGTYDVSFNIGTGFSGNVSAMELQSDGKIVIGGNFTSYNGVAQNYITRLNSDGTRDTSFSIGTGFNSSVSDLKIQSDGKIVVVGNFTNFAGTVQNYIARLNSNGSRDTGWNSLGGFNNTVNQIALQSDGKIVAVGNFSTYAGTGQNRITRITTTGARDTAFSISTGLGGGFGNAVKIQSDGKIVVSGDFTTYAGNNTGQLVRINTDGSRDTSVTVLGKISSSAGTTNVRGIYIQEDGKILITGTFTYYQAARRGIVRLNTDWTLDTTFSVGTGFSTGGSLLQPIPEIGFLNNIFYIAGAFDAYDVASSNNFIRLSNTGKAIDALDLVKFKSDPASSNFLGIDEDEKIRITRSQNADKLFLSYRLIEFTGKR